MILEPTPLFLENLYWITLLAVVVSSASGVLKAGFKQFDLFGVIIYPPEYLREFHTYGYEHIDNLLFTVPLKNC